MSGTLYIVATPIGNLADLSFRAVEILKSADLIAAEDTRQTGKLLKHYAIETPRLSYHEHNELKQTDKLVSELKADRDVALVSDAGTPAISDPGYRLVRACREAELPVVPVPGPVAGIAALSASGLPTDQFYFGGFPPLKPGKKKRFFEGLRDLPATLIFYESPHRIVKTLQAMAEVFEGREVVIARELTKLYEEFLRGSLPELIEQLASRSLKGEFVILLRAPQKAERLASKK